MNRCSAICLTGVQCKNFIKIDTFCKTHLSKEMIECGICLNRSLKKSNHIKELDCGHIFCKKCINTWIIQKENKPDCPNCRTLVSSPNIESARTWGLECGLLYRSLAIYYPINKLDEYDLMYMSTFCTIFSEKNILTNDMFILLYEQIKLNLENLYMFEKLLKLSYSRYIYVKKNKFKQERKVLHIFLQ